MYKFLLSTRYLRTRYIALASIISVTLGVATMIVVNSVMTGFQEEMYSRLHGILSDVVIESHNLDGFQPELVMKQVEEILGDDVEGMTATVHIPALLNFQFRNQWVTRQVNLIGIDTKSYTKVSDFGNYLLHPANREQIEFDLRESGYDDRLEPAGWFHRRNRVALKRTYESNARVLAQLDAEETNNENPSQDVQQATAIAAPGADPFTQDPFLNEQQGEVFDPMREQHTGIVLGISIASLKQRDANGKAVDRFLARPGDDVKISFPSVGRPPKFVGGQFTIVDLYESKMSEYDSGFAFVPIESLQTLRGMIDPVTNEGAVSSVQIKLRDGADLVAARDKLRDAFPPHVFPFQVQTWKDLQGPLLAAVQMETTILNILLFMIIAVAGFGILATFFMTVIEKTRDIGILKALGAPCRGVMSIFLGYGVSLGIVGSGVGMVLGLLFVANINRIAQLIERITGQEVFDPTIYYFQEIPTIVQPFTVCWIVFGAIAIAVAASVLPAMRAARLHPVEALRYE